MCTVLLEYVSGNLDGSLGRRVSEAVKCISDVCADAIRCDVTRRRVAKMKNMLIWIRIPLSMRRRKRVLLLLKSVVIQCFIKLGLNIYTTISSGRMGTQFMIFG